jgi:hypothetical protein
MIKPELVAKSNTNNTVEGARLAETAGKTLLWRKWALMCLSAGGDQFAKTTALRATPKISFLMTWRVARRIYGVKMAWLVFAVCLGDSLQSRGVGSQAVRERARSLNYKTCSVQRDQSNQSDGLTSGMKL